MEKNYLKILITILILASIPLMSFAQSYYVTIPETRYPWFEKFWVYSCFERDGDGHINRNYKELGYYSPKESTAPWYPDETTVSINGNEYTILYEGYYPDWTKHYFRDVLSKVYRYVESEDKEYCVYDFNLSEGDMFRCRDGRALRVTEVGTAGDYPFYNRLYGSDRKMLKLQDWNDPLKEDVWIEGVGSIHTGVLDNLDFSGDDNHLDGVFFMTVASNLPSEYALFDYGMDYYKSVTVFGTEVESRTAIEGYNVDIKFPYYSTIEFVDDTLHIMGYDESRYGGAIKESALVNHDEIALSTIMLCGLSGIISPRYWKFDAKIPGFKAGTYKISYPNGQPIELTCTGPVTTNIPENNVAYPVKHEIPIYDLSGRQIKAEPCQGIYIKDGRKYVR